MLDATYKTMKYELAFFFLCVRTNVGYSVVSESIVQEESAEKIAEALGIIKQWNPSWNPSFFMTDYSQAEVLAIERLNYRSSFLDFYQLQRRRTTRVPALVTTLARSPIVLGMGNHWRKSTRAPLTGNCVQVSIFGRNVQLSTRFIDACAFSAE